MVSRICQTCGGMHPSGIRCPVATRRANREREAIAPSRRPGQYDAQHRRRAAALRALLLPCSICGRPIDYTVQSPHPWSFVAHHTTRDKAGPLAPAHRRCNERAGRPEL